MPKYVDSLRKPEDRLQAIFVRLNVELIISKMSAQTVSTKKIIYSKGRLSYHPCVECFSQLSFDSEVYTKSATAADFVYTSESNESCEKHSTQR